MNKWLHISILAALLYACGTDDESKKKEEKIDFQSKNVLNPLFFSEANIFNLSFPLWFNQEVLEYYNIDSIYLESVVVNWTNDTVLAEEVDYSFTYAFKSNGWLKKSKFTDYYELTKLFEASFDYTKSTPDSMGYSLPRIEKTANLLIGTNPTKLLRTLSDLQRFDRLEFVRQDNEVIVFKNTTSSVHEQHIFIGNTEHQNILFVDKLETNPEDVFYYGVPQRYSKAFCLTDLVKEDLRLETTFFETENYPKAQKTEKNGLITNSVFKYDENGRWVGQQDSLMLNTGQFIKLTESEIKYNEQGLPKSIDIRIGSSENDLRTAKIVKLNYAFRKQKN